MNTWKSEAERLKDEQAKPPAGFQSIESIAAELACSEDHAKDLVNQLIKLGRAESTKGKKKTHTGNLIPCVYYRLVSEPAKPKK